MICIVNISKKPKLKGKQRYSLRINEIELCQFDHNREDHLDMCLFKAIMAYKDQQHKSVMDFYLNKMSKEKSK